MTEAEWLACTDPEAMLGFLRGRAGGRKLRLSACACCRRIRHLMSDERSRTAVRVGERYADGRASRGDLAAAAAAAIEARDHAMAVRLPPATDTDAMRAAYAAAFAAHEASYDPEDTRSQDEYAWRLAAETCSWAAVATNPAEDGDLSAEEAAQAGLVRDVFGNPFRTATFDPQWVTPAVTRLAQTIYDDRAFARMPELANALEAAGCADADVLAHCRGPGPHARGCWVVDLILGKG